MIILSYRATDLFETGEGGHDQSLTKNKLMIFLKIFILMLQSAYTIGIPADTYSQYSYHQRDLRRNEDRFTENYRNNIKRNHQRRSTIRSVGTTNWIIAKKMKVFVEENRFWTPLERFLGIINSLTSSNLALWTFNEWFLTVYGP